MYGEICSCRCHQNHNIKHIVSCCTSCPICDLNIRMGSLDNHIKECEIKFKNLMDKYNKID